MSHSIEDREIRGITFKIAALIISSTVMFTVTVLGVYFSLKAEITRNKGEREKREVYWDLKFEQLGLQLQTNQKQLEMIQQQLIRLQGEKNIQQTALYNQN